MPEGYIQFPTTKTVYSMDTYVCVYIYMYIYICNMYIVFLVYTLKFSIHFQI